VPYKIDVDKNPVGNNLQSSGHTYIIIFKNREIRWWQPGVFPSNELERLIKENI
jgi:hypothetical protein